MNKLQTYSIIINRFVVSQKGKRLVTAAPLVRVEVKDGARSIIINAPKAPCQAQYDLEKIESECRKHKDVLCVVSTSVGLLIGAKDQDGYIPWFRDPMDEKEMRLFLEKNRDYWVKIPEEGITIYMEEAVINHTISMVPRIVELLWQTYDNPWNQVAQDRIAIALGHMAYEIH